MGSSVCGEFRRLVASSSQQPNHPRTRRIRHCLRFVCARLCLLPPPPPKETTTPTSLNFVASVCRSFGLGALPPPVLLSLQTSGRRFSGLWREIREAGGGLGIRKGAPAAAEESRLLGNWQISGWRGIVSSSSMRPAIRTGRLALRPLNLLR